MPMGIDKHFEIQKKLHELFKRNILDKNVDNTMSTVKRFVFKGGLSKAVAKMKPNSDDTPTVSPYNSDIDKKINNLSTEEINKLQKLGWNISHLKKTFF